MSMEEIIEKMQEIRAMPAAVSVYSEKQIAEARTELMLKLFSERINKMSKMRLRPERHQFTRSLNMKKH